MAVAPDARSYRIFVVFLIGFAFSTTSYPAADDPVAQRQGRLLDNLRHVQVPYLGKDLGPATRYLSPRPWRSALARHTACLLNGAENPQATTWFKEQKNPQLGGTPQ